MEDSQKALELTREFIRLVRDYRQSQNPDIFDKMKGINKQYAIANGGGDLFSLFEDLQPSGIKPV